MTLKAQKTKNLLPKPLRSSNSTTSRCILALSTKNRWRLGGRRRLGSVLMCAMVVMIIAGLLTTQAIQTLILNRRNDDLQCNLYQARELIELGRTMIHQEKALGQKVKIMVDSNRNYYGTIHISQTPVAEGNTGKTRIVVHYPADQPGQVTASWEGPS
ncbi:hypothetical protein [Aureliella helgolandensis]|uniref:Uncharacterized protein n=1 Tax=Aureliella helgolandensis TaxID=2527968 RepID=A0A518GHP3_9BACT|nr:hypothetical protein [Aureliella helgolandensis]QDV28113.1 hypothetical protein Q31a_65080 [Aureliella helgolandensis]